MHVNRGLLNWGLFFILLGAIPLAVRQGLLTEDAVARAWTLWPLLLIGAGIGLVLRRTPFEFAGGLLSAATLGIIGGGLLASGGIPFASCGDESGSVAFPTRSGELGATAKVGIQLNCGELTIQAVGGSGWTVAGVDEDGSGPEIVAGPTSLEIRARNQGRFNFLGSRDRWALSVPMASTIDLDATVNAGEARLLLAGARLGRLDLTVNAGQATIDLGAVTGIAGLEVQINAGEAKVILPSLGLRGSVHANAGNIRLCPPAGAGLRVTMNDNITASNNFAQRGLVETSNNVWETPGYASAGVQLEIDAEANAGNVNVEPAGACGA
jgi:hypothetical protein